ncbi:hypothetical protein FEM48_Zijuj09G0145700 [Ziziphus jujuba var. spinosa]|uniref:Uncharacterized protein n=1 Tax=Ziziphus jujuba var. spinosa TaxID=714518 RepID=A0A978UTJ4_ZIZJJ|nr:hypothetical protein FEM48_Zijuj09G0145700 [Ziziphus jujuba var. spinosa]
MAVIMCTQKLTISWDGLMNIRHKIRGTRQVKTGHNPNPVFGKQKWEGDRFVPLVILSQMKGIDLTHLETGSLLSEQALFKASLAAPFESISNLASLTDRSISKLTIPFEASLAVKFVIPWNYIFVQVLAIITNIKRRLSLAKTASLSRLMLDCPLANLDAMSQMWKNWIYIWIWTWLHDFSGRCKVDILISI